MNIENKFRFISFEERDQALKELEERRLALEKEIVSLEKRTTPFVHKEIESFGKLQGNATNEEKIQYHEEWASAAKSALDLSTQRNAKVAELKKVEGEIKNLKAEADVAKKALDMGPENTLVN